MERKSRTPLFSPSLRKLPRALLKEPLRGASGEILDDKAARVNLTMNPLFGRGTLAKQSAGRVYNVDKENITNGSSSAGDTIIRDHLTPRKSPSGTVL